MCAHVVLVGLGAASSQPSGVRLYVDRATRVQVSQSSSVEAQYSNVCLAAASDPPISQMSYADQATSPRMSHAQNMPEVSSDAGYYSTSPSQQLVYPSPSPGLQNTSPNTPTSLPEIILTDFSAGQDINRQLDSEFLTDEQLKEGLGALDFAELQMLNNIGGMPEIVEDYRS
ncbi:hypothetical protein HUJ05_007388 [Dendroctonus ponderosae]|nr:hypothetical protein HUJ05_007388 [Dendroctonus ponderosae]